MTHDFEYISYDDADRIAILENKAAELEQRLLAAMAPGGGSRWGNVATPGQDYPTVADDAGLTGAFAGGPHPGEGHPGDAYPGEPDPYQSGPGEAGRPGAGSARGTGAAGPDNRTEALINHGRQRARRRPGRRILAHWRLLAVAAGFLVVGIVAALVATGGNGASWPASVGTVQAEIKLACQNPDVAAEPSGLDFACGPDTQPVLWVFSLLTSGNNPGYVDQATGRKGLEPITAAQGGDIAWSLNLHHPYDPSSPLDSLEVAARAINNIVSGATLTSSSGTSQVEPGLESTAANCQVFTGSSKLVTQQNYPAHCAASLTSSGETALVTDIFKQWMGNAPSATATDAGVLFANSASPGNPQVQAILSSLPSSGG
jgi:hypothetical protein